MTKPTTMKKPRANVYVNPKAPTWLKDMLAEVFPHANNVRAEEMAERERLASDLPRRPQRASPKLLRVHVQRPTTS